MKVTHNEVRNNGFCTSEMIYSCTLSPHEFGGTLVEVTMTLTAPGCGMGQVLCDDVEHKVGALPGVREIKVELVFDPPWSPEHMSETARLELGFF